MEKNNKSRMETFSLTSWNDRLRQERALRNWRQQDLADQLGTTVLTIRRWETGNQQPSAYFRIKLCALFGKNAQELGLLDLTRSASSTPESQETIAEAELIQPSLAEREGLWTIPYRRNAHFTGREELLERLRQRLSEEKPGEEGTTRRAALSQPQAIKGLGGIGKTQIAVEYAYRVQEQNRSMHILWINAGSSETLLTSFQTLAERLPNFVDHNEQDQRKLIAAVLRWLEVCQERWLLIFDNADELSLVQPYLPPRGRGSILFTTRTNAVSWLAHPIEVEQMSLMEGTQFLLHRAGRFDASDEEGNEATNIVIAVDGFPLALDQAGAYIEETGCGFRDYLELYEQHRATLLARRGKQSTSYPASVATTWELSFQQIEQVQPAAAELLHLCAYFSPDHIPQELITEGAMHWSAPLQQTVADPLRFNEVLEALLAFSLIKRLTEERLLCLHRLVQAVQLDRVEIRQQSQWAERVVRAVNTHFPADPKDDVATWPLCLRYLEQVQACDTLIQHHHIQIPEAADLLDRAGIYLSEHASYSLAESLFQRALAIAEQQLAPEHLQVASPLNNLGRLYYEQGKYEQAEPLLQRALHIREQILGSHHPQVAFVLTNLGLLYWKQGRYELSESSHQRALHIREQASGPHHLELASPLNNLGILYAEQGKYEQAEPLLQRALHIREQTLGSDHPQLSFPLTNLGSLYYEQGKYEQAEPLLQRALHIREQVLGPDHPQFASPLNNLGNLYLDQGKYEQAEPLLLRALHIREQALDPYHLLLTYPLTNLGLLYAEQGKYSQAEPLLQRAVQICEQALGPDHPHPQIATPLKVLANISQEQGQYQQADELYQRAFAILQEHLGPQNPEVAETLQDLGGLREKQQQPGEAISFYQRALAIREHVFGDQHPKTIDTRQRLCAILNVRQNGGSVSCPDSAGEPARDTSGKYIVKEANSGTASKE